MTISTDAVSANITVERECILYHRNHLPRKAAFGTYFGQSLSLLLNPAFYLAIFQSNHRYDAKRYQQGDGTQYGDPTPAVQAPNRPQ